MSSLAPSILNVKRATEMTLIFGIWAVLIYHFHSELADQRQYGKVIQRETKNIMQKTLGNLLATFKTAQPTTKTRSGVVDNSISEILENGER